MRTIFQSPWSNYSKDKCHRLLKEHKLVTHWSLNYQICHLQKLRNTIYSKIEHVWERDPVFNLELGKQTKEKSNLSFGDKRARAGSNLAEFALSTIIISNSRSLQASFCLFNTSKFRILTKRSFQIKLKTEDESRKKKTHKRNHMITFQFREKPFIHKRPEHKKIKIEFFRIVNIQSFEIPKIS